MLVAELLVLGTGDGGGVVPAKGFQGLADEFIGVGGVEASIVLSLFDQRQGAGGEDCALGQGGFGKGAQVWVFDQFQAQQ